MRISDIDLEPEDLAIVLKILQDLVPEHEVWIFGSRVTHKAKPFSDLDLAIITQEPLPLTTLGRLQEAFSESILPIKVDIIDWSRTDEDFKKIIAKNYIKLK